MEKVFMLPPAPDAIVREREASDGGTMGRLRTAENRSMMRRRGPSGSPFSDKSQRRWTIRLALMTRRGWPVTTNRVKPSIGEALHLSTVYANLELSEAQEWDQIILSYRPDPRTSGINAERWALLQSELLEDAKSVSQIAERQPNRTESAESCEGPPCTQAAQTQDEDLVRAMNESLADVYQFFKSLFGIATASRLPRV